MQRDGDDEQPDGTQSAVWAFTTLDEVLVGEAPVEEVHDDPTEQYPGYHDERPVQAAARLLDTGLDQAENRRRKHDPGSEAQHGVEEPLRNPSDERHGQGAHRGHQTCDQAGQCPHDEDVHAGERLDQLLHAIPSGRA